MSDDVTLGAVPAPEGETNVIETDYELGQDNLEVKAGPLLFDIHNPVFVISVALILAFIVITLVFQNDAEAVFVAVRDGLTSRLDWAFLTIGNVFVLLCLWLMVSRYGSIRLGGPEARPDFSYIGWFAMLFSAGMGIGLMFYGVSEPISHYQTALAGPALQGGARSDFAPLGGTAGDVEAARQLGMAASIFHWALHPWAIYAIVGLSLALFCYNKGLPLTLRSVFHPLLGDRVWGWAGHWIDILAVLATLFGLATSLGLGAKQASAGIEFLFGVPASPETMVALIIMITFVATLSVLAGLDAGVRRLSEINMALAALLLMFVVLAGPTLAIVTGVFSSIGAYVWYLPALSNPVGRADEGFAQGWTAFYWAWWISWSPFVGMFIARVSRGRTVREFLLSVLLIPSIASAVWIAVFGGAALEQITGGGAEALANASLELKLFEMLTAFPLTEIASFIGIVLVIVFFITSSDSGSLVVDTITAGGKLDAPRAQRVLWASFEGVVAIALLLGGGLAALQAAAVSTGFPFAIVLLLACVALIKGLADEPR